MKKLISLLLTAMMLLALVGCGARSAKTEAAELLAREEAERVLASGKNLILEIEVDGAAQVKAKFPQAVMIMLLPPSFAEQEKRLRSRGTETEEKILARLEQTKAEVARLDLYDYVVYNHDGAIENAVNDILCIIKAEKLSRRRNPDASARYFNQD